MNNPSDGLATEFTADFFIANRLRLRQLFSGTAPIVMTGNGLLQRNSDNTYRYRQDSSFWYLTGIDEPDITLVMDKDKEYLIVPERDVVRQAFDGSVSNESLLRTSGVETILDDKDGWKQLAGRLKRVKHVATLGAAPAYVAQQGLYPNPARAALIQRLRDYNGQLEVLDLREHMTRLRSIKQPVELAAIQRAVDVTIEGLNYVTSKKRLHAYAYEYQVEADLTRSFRHAGLRHAFEPIIAGGPRACQMHYMHNDGALSADELLVFDVGAEAGCYAADIARTVALSANGKEPSRRQQQVFDAVCDVQDFALSLLKPGTINVEYEKQVEAYLGEKLRELGLIKTIDHESVRKYFPHATTHFLGLDVHDVGDYHAPMEPGMTMVCEPGIYIPEEGIGVRIEDDIVITEEGNRVLSAAMPRRLV